jgi:hypothetical protein
MWRGKRPEYKALSTPLTGAIDVNQLEHFQTHGWSVFEARSAPTRLPKCATLTRCSAMSSLERVE